MARRPSGGGVLIAVPEIVVNVTASAPDLSAANALFRWDSTVQAPQGTPYQVIYKGIPRYVFTPDGRTIFYLQNGTNDEVFIYVSPGRYEKFKESMNVPSDYSTSAYFTASFLANHQETYYGWRAVDLSSDVDDDDDGIPNQRETAAGTNPYSNDSDGDGVLDRIEWDWNRDTDLDGKINAIDKDSDNDGVPDGTEDANRDGMRQKNETYATRQDSDLDLIQDGTELGFSSGTVDTNTTADSNHPGMWLFTPDAQNWTTTLPLDIDSDDDGLDDGKEDSGNGGSSNYNGRYDNTSETNGSTNDTDGDRLADGLELGVQVPTWQTDIAKFVADRSPLNTTDARNPDTDGDGLGDSAEDRNLDGTWTYGTEETDAGNWDSDFDGLCDGLCSGKGEDKNLNGIRDKNASGNWTETDGLANDSDHDLLLDGEESNGTWKWDGGVPACFEGQETNCILDPLNPDNDGDGLLDGQEARGWDVIIYHERTGEWLQDLRVSSWPLNLVDTDSDGLTDFEEFTLGSNPRSWDTDGDGLSDIEEKTRGSNITGYDATPPTVSNLTIWGDPILGPMWIMTGMELKMRFSVDDAKGIDRVEVTVVIKGKPETQVVESHALSSGRLHDTFWLTFNSTFEAQYIDGADVTIHAFDLEGNGVEAVLHYDSRGEEAWNLVTQSAAPIGNVLAAGASWLWDKIMQAVEFVLDPILKAWAWFEKEVRRAILLFFDIIDGEAAKAEEFWEPRIASFIDVIYAPGFFLLVLGLIVILKVTGALVVYLTAGSAAFVDQFGGVLAALLIGPLIGAVAAGSAILLGLAVSYLFAKISGEDPYWADARAIGLLALAIKLFLHFRHTQTGVERDTLALVLSLAGNVVAWSSWLFGFDGLTKVAFSGVGLALSAWGFMKASKSAPGGQQVFVDDAVPNPFKVVPAALASVLLVTSIVGFGTAVDEWRKG